jgi:hypothetical protein
MIRIGPITMQSDDTVYVPVPCRGVVVGLKANYATNAVDVGDTIIASRETTAVNTLTTTSGAGLVQETGTRDTTNKDLVFDPDTAAYSYIKLVANGTAGVVLVTIEFDDFAATAQAATEA